MGFDYKKVPLLLNQEFSELTAENKIFLDEKEISFEDLKNHSIETLPPPGWVNML
ncbi:MAG: hypothetical protein U5L09_08945 [Bacteroidales bacterium]|nr:hypothetical protein [Bacteroidales bacterium]